VRAPARQGFILKTARRRLAPRAQVRAGSLQELVYKQGQAGVTKASVSIVFNNSDPTRSPVGYESCEQITVTRQACTPSATASRDARHAGAYGHAPPADCHRRPQQVPHQRPRRAA